MVQQVKINLKMVEFFKHFHPEQSVEGVQKGVHSSKR